MFLLSAVALRKRPTAAVSDTRENSFTIETTVMVGCHAGFDLAGPHAGQSVVGSRTHLVDRPGI